MEKSFEMSMIFDDVRFGIEVRERREIIGWTQQGLAEKIGYKNGVNISAVECATKTDAMTVRRFMTLCNVLGLNPMHYWACDEIRGVIGADWTSVDHA